MNSDFRAGLIPALRIWGLGALAAAVFILVCLMAGLWIVPLTIGAALTIGLAFVFYDHAESIGKRRHAPPSQTGGSDDDG